MSQPITRTQLVVSMNTRTMRQVELPLSPYVWALLTLPHPLTDDEWEQMLTVLAVMRPGLTAGNVESATSDPARGTSVDGSQGTGSATQTSSTGEP